MITLRACGRCGGDVAEDVEKFCIQCGHRPEGYAVVPSYAGSSYGTYTQHRTNGHSLRSRPPNSKAAGTIEKTYEIVIPPGQTAARPERRFQVTVLLSWRRNSREGWRQVAAPQRFSGDDSETKEWLGRVLSINGHRDRAMLRKVFRETSGIVLQLGAA